MGRDNNIEEKIKQSLNFLDDNAKIITPGMGKFRMLVEQAEQKKRAKAGRQFLIFLFTALLLICLETFAFSRSLFAFIAIQAAAVVVVPLVTVLLSRLIPGRVKLD